MISWGISSSLESGIGRFCQSGTARSDLVVPKFLGKSGGNENELLNYLLIINSKIFIIL